MGFLNEKRKILSALAGGLAVALAVSGVTVVAALALVPHVVSADAPSPASSASPSPSPAHKANRARHAIHRAVMQAEAQALGMTPADFKASLKQGATVHQLADQKGISQATFQTAFIKALTPLLDHAVQHGTITQPQEQKALDRYGAHIPNWDRAPHHR